MALHPCVVDCASRGNGPAQSSASSCLPLCARAQRVAITRDPSCSPCQPVEMLEEAHGSRAGSLDHRDQWVGVPGSLGLTVFWVSLLALW